MKSFEGHEIDLQWRKFYSEAGTFEIVFAFAIALYPSVYNLIILSIDL